MSFLQPLLLAGLPLVALPVIIHLLNRRRHQVVEWGAMMFLLSANRQFRGKRRLRYLLIMVARMLVIAGLILGISRPLSKGWLGVFGAPPDTIIVVLDRSASMAQRDMQTNKSKREMAIEQVVSTLRIARPPSHLVLIESGTETPLVVTSIETLAGLPTTSQTDGSADIPSMLQKALEYVITNQAGRTDIWICSDTQQQDWNIESEQWASIRQGFMELKQGIRFHLLAYASQPVDNIAVRVESIRRQTGTNGDYLQFDVRASRLRDETPLTVPLGIVVDGARSVVNLTMIADSVTLKGQQVPVDDGRQSGWGMVELPADTNPRDSVFYFTYGGDVRPRTVIVAEQPSQVRSLAFAAAPPINSIAATARIIGSDEVGGIDWHDTVLILWQSPLPVGSVSTQLQQFVHQGGSVVFFPPRADSEGHFLGARWGAWNTAPSNDSFRIMNWRDDSGLLRNSQSGIALPLGKLRISAYRRIVGEGQSLARLSDGSPFLLRTVTDRGSVHFCTSLPKEPHSNLAREGVVMFAMLQRALQTGSARLSNAVLTLVGDPLFRVDRQWQQIAGLDANAQSSQRRMLAGVYQHGDQFIAQNRPATEDVPRPLENEQIVELMGDLDYHVVHQDVYDRSPLVTEIWRLFVVGMILALFVEAFLCLPNELTSASKWRSRDNQRRPETDLLAA